MRYEIETRDGIDVIENGTNAASDQLGALHVSGTNGKTVAVYAPNTWVALRESEHVTQEP